MKHRNGTSGKTLFTQLIGVCLMSVTLFGCTSVHTEIVIPATPEEVWNVLMDRDGYKEWNPVLIPTAGDLKEGSKLTYQMIQPGKDPVEVETKVIRIKESEELNQYGGTWGLLTFDHKWLLEPAGEGTRVTQHEEYRGVGVLFWDYSWVKPAYQKALEGLKNRVEYLINKSR